MNRKLHYRTKITRIFLASSLLTFSLSESLLHKFYAQNVWQSVDLPQAKPSPVIWQEIPESEEHDKSQAAWETTSESAEQNQSTSAVIWEVLEAEEGESIPQSKDSSNSVFYPPSNLHEAKALLDTIPLQSSDFKPLLDLSHAVPTASVLSQEEWHFLSSTISPFKSTDSAGNQNKAITLAYGLNDTLQISGFYSKANNPLNASITGLDIRPENFWEVFGAAARWKFLTNESWSLALNSSLESWTVGSGGSGSSGKNSGDSASPNIFNDSGKRVETQNLVGSISLPLTWHSNKKWQFTIAPAISFLPPNQGKGQGGSGEFYGTNPYISGGILWHPTAEIGVTASVAQPIGSGSNNFDRNLKYSKAPIFSGGLNWHLNPRIALQGQLTNGFGATPATGLLTLPSDNRLGYSANFVFTADAPDTPQPPLSPIQQSLSLGGITVDTALVPPDKTSLAIVNADTNGNLNTLFGYSISNIFHLDFFRSEAKNTPQDNIQAITFANNDSISWRGSGKAVLTSSLRGSPIWSALRISFGHNVSPINNNRSGYLFTETPLTWEANSKLALNISPKAAWTEIGNLWGIGVGANIKLSPRWELIPEVNIVLNSQQKSNGTLGIRWNTIDNIAIEVYGSTASSIVDIGQLLNAGEIRWGGRLIIKL